MTAQQLRLAVQAVVQAHHTHNTFYSIWSDSKDRETELTYPCAVWDSWRSRLEQDINGGWSRSVTVRLLVITAVATDRTPGDRDAAVEAADQAAEDYVLKLQQLWPDMVISNVATTTQFDEYTQLETGVLLSFTATGGPLCLDPGSFGPVCAAGVVANSDGTFTLSVPSGGTATLPDVTHTDSDGSPVVLPGMVPFHAAPCPETTVNGEPSMVPAITVLQGGVEVGSLNPKTGVVTVPVGPPDGKPIKLYDEQHRADPPAATLAPQPYERKVFAFDAGYDHDPSPATAVGAYSQDADKDLIRVAAPVLGVNAPYPGGGLSLQFPVGSQPDFYALSIRDRNGNEVGGYAGVDPDAEIPTLIWQV